jgi:hypothetical protein
VIFFACVGGVLQRGVRHGSGEYGFDMKFEALLIRFLGVLGVFGLVEVEKWTKKTRIFS